MLRRTGQWQGNRPPDNQAANKLVDAGGSWFEDVGSTPTASIFFVQRVRRAVFRKTAFQNDYWTLQLNSITPYLWESVSVPNARSTVL